MNRMPRSCRSAEGFPCFTPGLRIDPLGTLLPGIHATCQHCHAYHMSTPPHHGGHRNTNPISAALRGTMVKPTTLQQMNQCQHTNKWRQRMKLVPCNLSEKAAAAALRLIHRAPAGSCTNRGTRLLHFRPQQGNSGNNHTNTDRAPLNRASGCHWQHHLRLHHLLHPSCFGDCTTVIHWMTVDDRPLCGQNTKLQKCRPSEGREK